MMTKEGTMSLLYRYDVVEKRYEFLEKRNDGAANRNEFD